MNMIVLDIGGTKISSAISNEHGALSSIIQHPTEAHLGAEHILGNAFELVDELVRECKTLNGIGIASAGRIDVEKGIVNYATSNLPGWTGLSLVKIFEKKYGVPVAVDNDVNVAALGEGWVGAGRHLKSFICLTLGTGVGGAFVIDGEVWRGSHWSAAELGHMVLKANGHLCNCGFRGCVEQYVSGTAIFNRYNDLSGKDIGSAAQVFQLLAEGDPHARQVMKEFKEDLGATLLSLYNTFDPEAFIIGGGVLGAREYWWDDVETYVKRYKPVNILPAQLGNHAGLVGAAKLVLKLIHNPPLG